VLVRPDRLLLSRTARVNRVRPAVDPLFRSAARWYGARAVGVVLSGALDDGAAGLGAIWEREGACLIQHPADALFSGMPYAAMLAVPGAAVMPAAELGSSVSDLVRTSVPAGVAADMGPHPDPLAGADDLGAELDPDLVVETALTEGTAFREVDEQPGLPAQIA